MSYSIGEVANLAKVSIRTLHHYDAIGLLVPSARNEVGYRFYSIADLEKLQLIRFYRTLEFSLADIQQILRSNNYNREAILLQQRELLRARASELTATLVLLDDTLAALSGAQENSMNTQSMFEVFPELDETLQAEAEQRWGSSSSWQQSAQRSKHYTKADWQRLKDEMARLYAEAERVFRSGASAESAAAIACAEADRLMIHHWFYDCSREMHAKVKEGTSQDSRFVANIDRNCEGLALWLWQSAVANYKKMDRDVSCDEGLDEGLDEDSRGG